MTISPKMSIAKEFLLQPMNHPDQFARWCGSTLFIHSRDTVKGVTFEMFFATAKMAIWWLPEVNNMCRLNAIQAGGGRLSFNHNPSATGEEGVVEIGLTLSLV